MLCVSLRSLSPFWQSPAAVLVCVLQAVLVPPAPLLGPACPSGGGQQVAHGHVPSNGTSPLAAQKAHKTQCSLTTEMFAGQFPSSLYNLSVGHSDCQRLTLWSPWSFNNIFFPCCRAVVIFDRFPHFPRKGQYGRFYETHWAQQHCQDEYVSLPKAFKNILLYLWSLGHRHHWCQCHVPDYLCLCWVVWQKSKIIGQTGEVNKKLKVSCLHSTNKENYIEGSKETREIIATHSWMVGLSLQRIISGTGQVFHCRWEKWELQVLLSVPEVSERHFPGALQECYVLLAWPLSYSTCWLLSEME